MSYRQDFEKMKKAIIDDIKKMQKVVNSFDWQKVGIGGTTYTNMKKHPSSMKIETLLRIHEKTKTIYDKKIKLAKK